MPDICTLIVITTINTLGCASGPTCRMSEDGTKKYCMPMAVITCSMPDPVYECKKEDGTTYTVKQSDAK